MVYNHEKIEKKWQKIWEKEKLYNAKDFSAKPKFYGLIEFPYPSGEGLHVGHVRSNTAMDIIVRKRRMSGYNVLYPIGWDAFGLPTENYAVKTGIHPKIVTKRNTDTFRRQLKMLGFSFDWSREINTTDPNYYKWTQWIFLQLYKKGLAYKKKMPINWCLSCKIGLANEEVVGGRCERCAGPIEKREKEQWLLAITKYADKLLEDLKTVDYLEKIKIQQANWIGKSEGVEIKFQIPLLRSKSPEGHSKFQIEVFTTRPDTLFGATYMVLAPEHQLVSSIKHQVSNWKEVESYIKKAKRKTELQRTDLAKEKTGVELKSVKAINPANKKEIPVFVADYVLASYGTGAIMAVPAHDERDFEFAKKFKLPIIQVIAQETGIRRPNEEKRDGAFAFVFDPVKQKYAVGKDMVDGRIRLFSGGIDGDEDMVQGIKREVREEAGLYDFAHVEKIGTTFPHYHNKLKNVDRVAEAQGFLIILKSDKIKPVKLEEHEKFELVWVTPEEMEKNWQDHNQEGNYTHWINFLQSAVARAIELGFDKKSDSKKYKPLVYIGNGILVNSGKFSGMPSEKARWEITKFVAGKKQIQYHLRDWIFSRQHYWGEPIPIIFCEKCGEVPVPEKDLPVKLPDVKNYKPIDTGESPLAAITNWVNTKCPKCRGKAKRETDTMPNWAGSSWYFLRYIDPRNNKVFADFKKLKYWMPVDWYNGGMEHTTLHLLYSRFWNKFLYDIGVVPVSEPYKKRTSHGMVLGEGGEKMSKSRGNVVNPDHIVKKFGADTFRLYEMFIGPFDQAIAWDYRGLGGCHRFLGKAWNISQNKNVSNKVKNPHLEKLLHQTIKKVGDDIESMNFNTAVSSLMIFVNECYNSEDIPQKIRETFPKLLAPFAPYLAEELWEKLGHKNSIHLEPWPKYDVKLIKEDEFELVIQINGKVRDKVSVQIGISQKEAEKLALSQEKIKIWLKDKKVKKIIFVPNRLINFVLNNG
jgi:leucyl-tRNA synthetase